MRIRTRKLIGTIALLVLVTGGRCSRWRSRNSRCVAQSGLVVALFYSGRRPRLGAARHAAGAWMSADPEHRASGRTSTRRKPFHIAVAAPDSSTLA